MFFKGSALINERKREVNKTSETRRKKCKYEHKR